MYNIYIYIYKCNIYIYMHNLTIHIHIIPYISTISGFRIKVRVSLSAASPLRPAVSAPQADLQGPPWDIGSWLDLIGWLSGFGWNPWDSHDALNWWHNCSETFVDFHSLSIAFWPWRPQIPEPEPHISSRVSFCTINHQNRWFMSQRNQGIIGVFEQHLL